MELALKLADLLQKKASGSDLKAWRFSLHDTSGIEVGLKNNRIGGPYSAPSYKKSISGELFLIWGNNRYTSAKLDAQVTRGFEDYFELWRSTAFYDADGVGLFTPDKLPEVPLADQTAREIAAGASAAPFQLLDEGCCRLTGSYGAVKVDGKVRCYQERRVIINSAGFHLDYLQTPVEFYFEMNDRYGESYQEKRWPEDDEVRRLIDNTGRIGRKLGTQTTAKLTGPIRLLLPPPVFEMFLNYFLIENLFGSLVMNRQSKYSMEDFISGRMVLREDLSLIVNTIIPYRAFSYPCTSEAVPGGEMTLIDSGRLGTPLLNLKYAHKAGMKPTPMPSGGRGFFLKTCQPLPSWDELVAGTESGLIVYSVLGLHTQDFSTGNFSLTADQCLLVRNGEIVGKVKAVINGDFLGSLLSPQSRLGSFPGEDNPGYSFIAAAAT